MKKRKLTLAALTVYFFSSIMLFTSCDKDDFLNEIKIDNPNVSLLGTWNFGDVKTNMTVDGESYKSYLETTVGLSEKEAEEVVSKMEKDYKVDGYITFKEDGTFVQNFKEGEPQWGKWAVNTNDQITLTVKGDNQLLTIVKLNDELLQVYGIEDRKQDLNNDNKEDLLKVEITNTLLKSK
ncbi:hypothetical protein [Saccharicrinis aurantiacus]|uniref:hypothetical protein n=1 Tax=Saccharicrinis aurantiacus TaxID=1849719 RepID=UPI0008398B0A|nr:hypothetical protein [Saccharicrinis aurantiacus]